MPRKPNYNFERQERERAKLAKKAAKQEAKSEQRQVPNDDLPAVHSDAGQSTIAAISSQGAD